MALLKIEDVKSHSEIAQKLRSFIEMNSHRTKKRVSQGYHKRGTYLGRRTSRAVLIMKNQRTYANLLQKGYFRKSEYPLFCQFLGEFLSKSLW